LARGARAGGAFALAERHRWPLWLPVGMGAGIGFYFALPVEPSVAWTALVGLAGLACAAGAPACRGFLPRAALALLAALVLGFVLAKGRVMRVAAPVLPHKLGPVYVQGRIETVEARPQGVRVVLGDLLIPHLRAVPRRARITIRTQGPALAPGQWIGMHAMLMPPPAPVAPGAYDFGRAAYFQSIGAVGYAYGRAHPAEAWRRLDWHERIAAFVEQLRWAMTMRIHAVLPGSRGAIAAALITGERGGIAPQDAQSLRDAGLAHVLAIAGLHMALVGLGLFWAVRALLAAIPALALRYPIKKWAALAALLSTAFYLLISGAAASAMRAFIMLAMMLIAILLDRPALSMRAIALAATIILVLQPESLVQPGFQMSFAAVASLIALAEWDRAHRLRVVGAPRPRFAGVWRYVRGIAVTSFVGSIATIPYSVFHFGRATHYAVLGNLLAMPIMGFVTMPAAALSVIAMPFGLESVPLHGMAWGIGVMLAAGRWVSGLPGAVSLVAAWPVGALAVLSLGGLWVLIWRGGWRWLGLLPLGGAIVFAMTTHGPDMLVAGDAMTVAVRGPDGRLGFVDKPHDKYAASAWLQRDGDRRDPLSAPAQGVRCDGFGCVLHRKGRIVAISARFAALAEDCMRADIVVAAFDVPDCAGPKRVIGRRSALHDGGYAIDFAPLRIESVTQARGLRPWSHPPKDISTVSNGG
jgi:competence protein ComEC